MLIVGRLAARFTMYSRKKRTIFCKVSQCYENIVFYIDETIPTIPNTVYVILQKSDFQHLHFNAYCLSPRVNTAG
jgi:hypothetical protein